MEAKNTTEEEMDLSNDDAFSDASIGSNISESEVKPKRRSAWAVAMSKVLNAKVPKEKNFILSKGRKDSDIKEKKKQEIEIVNESGNVVGRTVIDKKLKSAILKERRKIKKQKEKSLWESMCRVKPDVTQKERERELVRIATRGVVHLFNTVEKHQKTKKDSKEKSLKRNKDLGKVKGNFMDILKGFSKKDLSTQDDPAVKKAKQEETWSILKDDFMMGAEMKDWDKESDND